MRFFHILIWGTGNWAREFISNLPENVIVDAFVESTPQKNSYLGTKVIGRDLFETFYNQTDLTIIAVDYSDEIKAWLTESGFTRRVFDLNKRKSGQFYSRSLDVPNNHEIHYLFTEKYNNTYNCSYTSSYCVCDCDDLKFICSSKYKMMINELNSGVCYQKADMDRFLELSEKYYGLIDNTGFFVDVGANIGTTSVYIKNKLRDIKILAFEPIKENYKQFMINILLNNISTNDVIVSNSALSDENCCSEIMLGKNSNMGDNRLVKNGNMSRDYQTEMIMTRRLDDYISEIGINPNQISYIWMDVQAHEAFVFEGGMNTILKAGAPMAIEFWPEELKKNDSFELLIANISKCYSKFIPIQKWVMGADKEHEISELYEFADTDKCACGRESYDIFLIR